MPALHPLILAGEAATAAHPMWTDAKLEAGQTIAFELGACRKRYNVGLARTVHMGAEKPAALIDTAKAVEEGMQAVMESLRADVIAGMYMPHGKGCLIAMDWKRKAGLAIRLALPMRRTGVSIRSASGLPNQPSYRKMPLCILSLACGWMVGVWS